MSYIIPGIHLQGVAPHGRSCPHWGQQPKNKKTHESEKKTLQYPPGGLIGRPAVVREKEPPAVAKPLAGVRTAARSAPARSATGGQAVLSAVPVA